MPHVADEVGHDRQRAQIQRSTGRLMGGDEEMIDQDARDDAAAANSKIDGHEKLCAERWNNQRDSMARVEKGMAEVRDILNKRISQTSATLITIMTGIICVLATLALTHH